MTAADANVAATQGRRWIMRIEAEAQSSNLQTARGNMRQAGAD
jgi:hypothetical protein